MTELEKVLRGGSSALKFYALRKARSIAQLDCGAIEAIKCLLGSESQAMRIEALDVLVDIPGDHLPEQIKQIIREKNANHRQNLILAAVACLLGGVALGAWLF